MTRSTEETLSDDDKTVESKLEKSDSRHSLDLSFESLSEEENTESDSHDLIVYPVPDPTLTRLFEALRNNVNLQETTFEESDISQFSNESPEYSSFILFGNEEEDKINVNSPWTSFVGKLGMQQLEEERLAQEANREALITYPVLDTSLIRLFETLSNNVREQEASQHSFYELLFNFNNLRFAAMAIIIGVVYEFYFHNEGC